MKNKSLTLSIVIPVYNEQGYLKACLDSIARQTVPPDEVIVVDNNSSDKTVEIARKYSFVRVLSEKHQGIVHARNSGFDAVKSDLIGRIDADTHLAVDWVERSLDYFGSHPATAAATGSCYFYDFPFHRAFGALHTFIYYVLQKWIAGSNILWGSNMVVRRRDWLKVRKYCSLRRNVHEDIDLSLVLHAQGFKIGRNKAMRAGVSLRRGDLGIRSLYRYLGDWWRTYTNHRLYIRAVLIYFLALITLLSAILWVPFKRFIR